MATYSINNNLATETISWNISGTPSYFDYIMDTLEDNTAKIISPRILRDAILSLHDDIVFKETTSGAGIAYIGIDSGNPLDRDVKKKMFWGKRAFSGNSSFVNSHTIMNSNLLSSDYDHFFYNTKADNQSQLTTKIQIISGSAVGISNNFSEEVLTNSGNILQVPLEDSETIYKMPLIQSQYVTGNTVSLSLDFINRLGDIDVKSETGTVSIANISFPTISDSFANISQGRVLKIDTSTYQLYWDDVTFTQIQSTTGSLLELFGTPANLNGFALEFSDSRMCPTDFGELKYGDTFENFSISEMLKRIIYQYLPPSCSIKIRNQAPLNVQAPFTQAYVEVGTQFGSVETPTPIIDYEINKKTQNLSVTTLTNMIPGIYSPIVSNEYVNIFDSSQGIIISPVLPTTTIFTISTNDGTTYISKTASITGVYPYFCGFSPLASMTIAGLADLTKFVEPKKDKVVDFSGSGNLYYIYPKIYGTLSNIYDDGGNDYLASGTFSGPTTNFYNSPSGLWASVEYYVYQWNSATIATQNFQFVF
jgi:hypothetical protein